MNEFNQFYVFGGIHSRRDVDPLIQLAVGLLIRSFSPCRRSDKVAYADLTGTHCCRIRSGVNYITLGRDTT